MAGTQSIFCSHSVCIKVQKQKQKWRAVALSGTKVFQLFRGSVFKSLSADERSSSVTQVCGTEKIWNPSHLDHVAATNRSMHKVQCRLSEQQASGDSTPPGCGGMGQFLPLRRP